MSQCSYPTNGLVSTIAPDHHACILQLHLTSNHVFMRRIQSACISVTVPSYQLPGLLHLHPTISHVCNNCTRPFPMSLTVASNQQSYHSANLCLQACMSDTLARDQHTYFYHNIHNLCCLLHLQQTRKVIIVSTIAPGKQACTNRQSRW